MIYFEKDYLTVHWNDTAKYVLMEWRKFVIGTDFRQGLDKGLQLVQEKQSTRWLADLRKLGVVAQEDQQWSNENWFPRAINAGLRRMAIVMPENIVSKWSVEKIMEKVPGTNLTVHYFDNIEKAKQWLVSP